MVSGINANVAVNSLCKTTSCSEQVLGFAQIKKLF
jgi:hypothetical protein